MTARVIPMPRHQGVLAQLRAAEAKYRQAKFLLVELATALEEVAPNHAALEKWRAFLTPPPNDTEPESR